MQLLLGPVVHVCLIAVLLVLVCVSPSQGLCGPRNFCCKGKNISCSSFDWLPNKSGRLSWKRCFCDEFCVRSGDCCSDFHRLCVPKREPCEVSDWSVWTPCTKKCGIGISTRTRTVVFPPLNGGRPCPPLREVRTCVATNCPSKKSVIRNGIAAARRLKESGRIIPSRFSKWRDHQQFSMSKDIRKNLFQRYHAANQTATQSLCARYRMNYVKPFCTTSGRKWASSLYRGLSICVACHPHVMNSFGRPRCPGLGDYQRVSRWKAVGVPYCDGTWTRISFVRTCDCPSDLPNSFTFV